MRALVKRAFAEILWHPEHEAEIRAIVYLDDAWSAIDGCSNLLTLTR